jgi:hypothetical protein
MQRTFQVRYGTQKRRIEMALGPTLDRGSTSRMASVLFLMPSGVESY